MVSHAFAMLCRSLDLYRDFRGQRVCWDAIAALRHLRRLLSEGVDQTAPELDIVLGGCLELQELAVDLIQDLSASNEARLYANISRSRDLDLDPTVQLIDIII